MRSECLPLGQIPNVQAGAEVNGEAHRCRTPGVGFHTVEAGDICWRPVCRLDQIHKNAASFLLFSADLIIPWRLVPVLVVLIEVDSFFNETVLRVR